MKYGKIFRMLALAVVLPMVALAIPATPVSAQYISVAPTSGKVGTAVAVTGTGFTPGVSFQMFFATGTAWAQTKSGLVTSGGIIYDAVTIPECPKATYTIWVGTPEYASNSFTVTPNIALSESSDYVGEELAISGTGFAASKTVTIVFDSIVVGFAATDANGSFTDAAIPIPESYVGSHTVKATDADSNYDTAGFITKQSIAISPTSGVAGEEVTVTGTGFKANKSINITYNGTSVTTSPVSFTADSVGSFSTKFDVPAYGSGTFTVAATDGTNQANASFSASASVSLAQTTGSIGSEVTISGIGFEASNPVTITFAEVKVGTVATDADGSFSGTFTVPNIAGGDYAVTASDGVASGSDSFTVLASMSISKDKGSVGTEVTVTGSGFKAGTAVTITFAGAQVGTATTDAAGNFSGTFTVPATAAATGTYKVEVSDGVSTESSDFSVSVDASISQETGYVGSELTISGIGFTGEVTVKYDAVEVAKTTAEASGAFSATFSVPVSVSGEHIITAGDGANTIQKTFTMESEAPLAPALLLPEDAEKAKEEAYLDWEDVDDPSGVTYILQIATDDEFTADSVLLETTGLIETEYTLLEEEKLESTKKEAPYYWRVKAVDAASNEGEWSALQSFYVGFTFGLPDWAKYVLIGLGALLIGLLGFWMGRRTAYYY
ncbi:IPT/TIG domain-containing protein [Chloroflexota bacterium]